MGTRCPLPRVATDRACLSASGCPAFSDISLEYFSAPLRFKVHYMPAQEYIGQLDQLHARAARQGNVTVAHSRYRCLER